ncbi:Uu.00g005560.m01.CDS01 [Anthostomella pinea]|uniref:Potassium transport protein n=1 Tax=Anthostomella pinea TaxID=933095 RepID=A0AAI8VK61_9PEZI|nr:Uu.00g005560.m01.CDS01 [Anthostomella pinea]
MPNTRERVVALLQALRPSFVSKHPHFDFITVHYFWIIGWTIVGSILMFASADGHLAYIDSLAFAAGANTQAGLNTVDVNLLNTFQQAVMYFLAMLSNPITINSSVVFLRLYWFEKRFQHIVKEARMRRNTITNSRSQATPTTTDTEKGVNGRHITVMHNTAKASRMTNDGLVLDEEPFNGEVNPGHLGESPQTERGSDDRRRDEPTRLSTPQIKFADQVKRSDAVENIGDEDRPPLPTRRSHAEHIAILEKQRKADKSVLRIPGPRDADQGAVPEEFEEDDEEGPAARRRRGSSVDTPTGMGASSPPGQTPFPDRQPTIIFEEPKRPRRDGHHIREDLAENVEAAVHVAGALKFRRPRRDEEALQHVDTATSSALPTGRINPLRRIRTALTHHKDDDPMPYLSWQPTLARNSNFVGLSEEQREELGGIEYRSLKTLALVLTIYFWGYTIFGIVCLLPWILQTDSYGKFVDAAGVNRTWWAFWTSNSAFMDLGFTLTPDSMNSFNTAIFPLLVMSFLIILGNTGFPIMLRFMIWLGSVFAPRGSGVWEELRFLLDHPRRCFTLLFPSNANWWLFFILVALNGIDLILFIVLDLGSGAVAELPLNIRFLDGWFQAASTRTAGFSCINLALIHPAVQTSYLIMMYISVFPVAISIRRTNVYEEKSLGVFNSADEDTENLSGMSYVGTHLRRQLSFDLWYIFIGYFILTITEGSRLTSGDFSMFAVLFEVVSAYGTVGLSLGYTGINASLCSQFSVIGKLVIIAMMIRGRHRGLPYGLDRAVLLPSEHLDRKEDEDAELRLQRRMSTMSAGGLSGRPMSLSRARTRSVDHRNVFTGLLHPGPAYPHHSVAKSETVSFGRSMSLRKVTTDPASDENADEPPVSPTTRPRRAETQPAFDH